MVSWRYGISLRRDVELNTPRDIPYLRPPMYYSLYIVAERNIQSKYML